MRFSHEVWLESKIAASCRSGIISLGLFIETNSESIAVLY